MSVTDGENPGTPFQEAVSIITITAILVAVGCYAAAVNNVPVLAPMLYWVATEVYRLFPALKVLHQSQVPMLVSAAAVGVAFFFLTIPLANWLAGVFSRAGIDNLERQTARLKEHREKLKKKRRDRDDFIVS
jgi:hypothetical protein